jgi:glycosyltransferase involved in cell wall biosynthesis/archaellum component FlaC
MTAAPANPRPSSDVASGVNPKGGFHRFKSEMPDSELEALCDTLSGAFDIEITLDEAKAAQARIQSFVASMEGRVGEGVDDLLALWFTRRAAALSVLKASKSKGRPKVNSFEIGALFGGSGGTSIMAVDDLKIAHRLVVIDPLDGYYGQPVDPVTGASVDPDTLSRNFARAGAEPTDFEIVQGLSENPEIIARACRLKYASGYIDGDHTLLGIHNDWFEYTPRIQLGGYAIVDNYDDPTSVEVSHFMDSVVLTELADYWTPVLKLGQTIVLRKDAEAPIDLHRRLAGSINLDALRANIRWRDEELSKVTYELGERRKQVQIRNEKIDRIQTDVKRLESERDLIAEKTRSEAGKEYAPRIAELDKALAERTAELKALRESHCADREALETARMKAQRLESELGDQAARLSELNAENKAGADRAKALERQVEEAVRSRDEERAALKAAEAKLDQMREQAGEARLELDRELAKLRGDLHERDLEVARLSERLESRDRELEGARRAETAAQAALEKARDKADALDRQTRDQDGVIRELQFKVQQAAYEAEQHAETRKALTTVRAELEAALEKAAALKAEKAESDARLKALEAELGRLSAERDDSAARADEAQGQAEALSLQLAALNERQASLVQERDDAQTMAERSNQELAQARLRLETLDGEATAARGEVLRLQAELQAGAGEFEALRAQLQEASARAERSETSINLARERITILAEASEASAADLRKAQSELAAAVKAKGAANDKAKTLEHRLDEARRNASSARQSAEQSEVEAQAMREHTARLEARLKLLEAQQVAPRIMLRRLLKSTVVRTLEMIGRLTPGDTGRGFQSAAARLRGPDPATSIPALAAPKLTVPDVPPTPDMHDAGPPQHDLTYFVNYTFGGKTRYLRRADLIKHTGAAASALRELRGAFKGQRCFVMGNGPSLNEQNLRQLKDEFTIGANYIYMNQEKMGFAPTVISFANYLVIEQRLDEILALPDPIKVLPFYLFESFGAPDNTILLNMQHQTPEFSTDATCFASTQSTVTYVNLQLAYYLGFDTVYMIGVDNRYKQPDRGREGTVLTQEEDDPNHFTPNYFKGLKWQKGDTERIEWLYGRAKEAFEARGSRIIDCTHNGALTVFEKGDLDTVIRRSPPPPASLIEQTRDKLQSVPRTPSRTKPKRVVVTVSPDLEDRFGHHYNMDNYLREQVQERGDAFISVCSLKVDQRLADECAWLIPAISLKTWWSLRDQNVIARKCAEFERDMRKALKVIDEAYGAETPMTVYMYTGNLPLGLALKAALADRANVKICVHHFYAAMLDMEDPEILEESTRQLRELSAAGVRVTLGTEELARYYKQKTGLKLDMIPGDPSTTFTDDEVDAMIANPDPIRRPPGGVCRVLFPTNMNVEKGYGVALDGAERISNDERLSAVMRPVLRYVPRPNTDKGLVDKATFLKERNTIEFVEGVLSDDDFRELTLGADIIAITYSVAAFERRMSGSLVDAILCAKPLVGTRNTYVGNRIERYDCGAIFEDGDATSLCEAIEKVASNYEYYLANAQKARKAFFEERAWRTIYARAIQETR